MSVQVQAGGSLRTPMSYEEYQALGETKHTEYYDGLSITNPPSRRHVLVAYQLGRLLGDRIPGGYQILPEWGWQPAQEAVFVPDILVAAVDSPGPDLLRAPPLLIVEITSPSTRGEDLGRKMSAYAEGGAAWYWIADLQADTLTVYRNDQLRFTALPVGGVDQPLELTEPFPITLDLAAVFA